MKAKSFNQLLCWHHKTLSAKHFDIRKWWAFCWQYHFSVQMFFHALSLLVLLCNRMRFHCRCGSIHCTGMFTTLQMALKWKCSRSIDEERKKCNHLFEWTRSLVIAYCSIAFSSALPWGRNKRIKRKPQILDRGSIYRMKNRNVLFSCHWLCLD